MNILKALPVSFAALALAVCPAMAKDGPSVSVTPVAQDADALNGGIVYALPQTVLRIKLTAQVIVESVGPYYQYSTRYLNLTDVVTQNQAKWSLVSADIETVGVADYSKRFKVSAADAAQLPSLALAEDGVLLAVNGAAALPEAPVSDAQPVISFANFADVPLSQSALSRTSKAAQAEDVAQTIYALRSARISLISGDKEAASLPDAGSYKLALSQIDNLERRYVELFAGRRDTITVVKYVDVTPDYNGANSVIPVRFSQTAGFVDALDLTGKPVYVDMEFSDASKLNAFPDGSKQRVSAPLTGLRYCVPGLLSVKVLDRNILLCQSQVRCSQNGQIAALHAAMLQTHTIVLDSATGALVSVVAIPSSTPAKSK